jgi:hypothetical protein
MTCLSACRDFFWRTDNSFNLKSEIRANNADWAFRTTCTQVNGTWISILDHIQLHNLVITILKYFYDLWIARNEKCSFRTFTSRSISWTPVVQNKLHAWSEMKKLLFFKKKIGPLLFVEAWVKQTKGIKLR